MTNFKSLKVKLLFTNEKLRCVVFQQMIHIKVNIFPSLSISIFVLALLPLMSVRIVHSWHPEQMNTLARISHIYEHLMSSKDCLDKCFKDCFSVLDATNTMHLLKIKESLYIKWLKPILNKQKQCQYITLLSF